MKDAALESVRKGDVSKPLYAISPEEDQNNQTKGIARSNTHAPTKEKAAVGPYMNGTVQGTE